MSQILSTYLNGGYQVSIDTNGTKIRQCIDASIRPIHPELMDIKITDYCDAGCAWCHEKSTPSGSHGDLDVLLDYLAPLPAGVEVAIGGGNPLSHPGLEPFLEELSNRGIIASITVNGIHFDNSVKRLEKLINRGHLFGVGVSHHKNTTSWNYPHLVHHVIIGTISPFDYFHHWTKFDANVLLLGYKTYGRGQRYINVQSETVTNNILAWRQFLSVMPQMVNRVAFDNLAIEQLQPKSILLNEEEYSQRFMGEDGDFSMYIDAVTQSSKCASYKAGQISWTDLLDDFGRIKNV